MLDINPRLIPKYYKLLWWILSELIEFWINQMNSYNKRIIQVKYRRFFKSYINDLFILYLGRSSSIELQ